MLMLIGTDNHRPPKPHHPTIPAPNGSVVFSDLRSLFPPQSRLSSTSFRYMDRPLYKWGQRRINPVLILPPAPLPFSPFPSAKILFLTFGNASRFPCSAHLNRCPCS